MHRKHYFSNASDRGITSIHEMQQCALEERKQCDEEGVNFRRAKADVDRQKRYLEQRECDDELARARRAASLSSGM